MPVYLIHFDRKLSHAQHYLGYADNVTKRIARHRSSQGARLLRVLNEQGIGWNVVRVWPDGDKQLERALKKKRNSSRLCPICTPGVCNGEEQEADALKVTIPF